MKKQIILFFSLLLIFLSAFAGLSAQVLRDTSTLNLIKKEVDLIYDLKFSEAAEISKKINHLYPGHPVVLLLHGMTTYWENYPMITNSAARSSFENDLYTCIDRCDKYKQEDEAEFLLANLCARGMLLLYYADNNLSSEVNSLAMKTYRYIRRAFNYTQTYSDFYFFTGLYNYYREAYPDAHPIYKALAFLFPKGDRVKGLKELNIASAKSIVLKAEAYTFLASIFMSFENNYSESARFSISLLDLYPSNLAYQANCIRDLLLTKKYDEAEGLIISASKNSNRYFQAQLTIFKGILQEKKYKDPDQAQQFYLKGVSELLTFGDYGKEFAAYGYFGLSRISGLRNDKREQKSYRNKANDFANYKMINFDN
jgi:hypothetical protein